MPFAPDSMGCGHRPFGRGPYGHGPWITYPFTPGFVVGADLGYAGQAVAFEDGTEQRFLRSRERGLSLTYEWPYVDSATVAAMSSFYQATNGAATRVIVTDHMTGLPQVARCTSPFAPTRGEAMTRGIGLQWKVDRAVTYAEAVLADSPAVYFRLGDASGVSTLYDAGPQGKHAPVAGVRLGLDGPLTVDRNTSMACSTTVPGHGRIPAFTLTNTWTVELWFRQATHTPSAQVFLRTYTGSGTHLSVAIQNGLVAMTQHSATCGVPNQFVADDAWHYLGWSRTQSAQLFVIDGVNLTPTVTSVMLAASVTSASIASAGTTLTAFDGMLDEVAVYDQALTVAQMTRHYQIGMRP